MPRRDHRFRHGARQGRSRTGRTVTRTAQRTPRGRRPWARRAQVGRFERVDSTESTQMGIKSWGRWKDSYVLHHFHSVLSTTPRLGLVPRTVTPAYHTSLLPPNAPAPSSANCLPTFIRTEHLNQPCQVRCHDCATKRRATRIGCSTDTAFFHPRTSSTCHWHAST